MLKKLGSRTNICGLTKFLAILLITSVCPGQSAILKVDRKNHLLKVYDAKNKLLIVSPVGIGRGGFTEKHNMNDAITPSGRFKVNIILSEKKQYNSVSSGIKNKYLNTKYEKFFESKDSLEKLFGNMNNLDFNHDSKPDKAYGVGYIGINYAEAKIAEIERIPYWFSIALHGTDEECKNIPFNKSGGCIHVPATVLKRLISEHIVNIGTSVEIN